MRTELPILSFTCVALITMLSPLHWKSRNVAMLSIIIWLFVANLIQGINSTVWLGNATVRFAVWCDIGTSFAHFLFKRLVANAPQRPSSGLVSSCLLLQPAHAYANTYILYPQTHTQSNVTIEPSSNVAYAYFSLSFIWPFVSHLTMSCMVSR